MMMAIKRYGPTCDCMSEMAWGDYVHTKDYDSLQSLNAELLEALEAISTQLSADGFDSGTTYGPLCIKAIEVITKARMESND